MSGKNLHNKRFDEATLVKLGVFEEYTEEWLPVFITSGFGPVQIFDFFAGTGYDKNGTAGSPIRILNKIKKQVPQIVKNRAKIEVHFNEFEPGKRDQRKFEMLAEAVGEYLAANKDVSDATTVSLHNKDLKKSFRSFYQEFEHIRL